MASEVFMPKMSDHMEYGEILEWKVGEGDSVVQGQVLVEVMTDKATAEIEAQESGVLRGIRGGAERGARVPVGETIAFITQGDEGIPELPPLREGREGPKTKGGGAEATPVAVRTAEKLGVDLLEVRGSGPGGKIQKDDVLSHLRGREQVPEKTHGAGASPAARRRAKELGVNVAQVQGTGPDGLVREKDVLAFHERGPEAGTGRWLELNAVQRLTGERMAMSAATVPQFALSVHTDVEKLLAIRDTMMRRVESESGRRLSVTTLLVKILAAALQRYPRANSSFQNGKLRVYSRINIGVAVGTESGLVVPVVREADRKSVIEINSEMKSIEEKARVMRFSVEDFEDAYITLTNLGMYGIEQFNAIINPPQSSILAIGSIMNRPVGSDCGTVVLKKMMNLTLSVDHRCLDGIQAAQFLKAIQGLIELPDIFVSGG